MNSRYIGALGALMLIVATSAQAASPYTTFSVLRGTALPADLSRLTNPDSTRTRE